MRPSGTYRSNFWAQTKTSQPASSNVNTIFSPDLQARSLSSVDISMTFPDQVLFLSFDSSDICTRDYRVSLENRKRGREWCQVPLCIGLRVGISVAKATIERHFSEYALVKLSSWRFKDRAVHRVFKVLVGYWTFAPWKRIKISKSRIPLQIQQLSAGSVTVQAEKVSNNSRKKTGRNLFVEIYNAIILQSV